MARFLPEYSWVGGGWGQFQHLCCPKWQWTCGSSREPNQGGQLSRGPAQMNAFHVVLWHHSTKRVSSLPIFTKRITNSLNGFKDYYARHAIERLKHGGCHYVCLKTCWKKSPTGPHSHSQSRKTDKETIRLLTTKSFLPEHYPSPKSSLAWKHPESRWGWKNSWCQTVAVCHCSRTSQRTKKDLAHPTDGARQVHESPMNISPLRDIIPAGNVITQSGPQGSPSSPLL